FNFSCRVSVDFRCSPSFPTRRSSDLLVLATPGIPDSRVALSGRIEGDDSAVASKTSGRIAEIRFREGDSVNTTNRCALARSRLRSEEHTSELQSRGHLVCRLPLETKK